MLRTLHQDWPENEKRLLKHIESGFDVASFSDESMGGMELNDLSSSLSTSLEGTGFESMGAEITSNAEQLQSLHGDMTSVSMETISGFADSDGFDGLTMSYTTSSDGAVEVDCVCETDCFVGPVACEWYFVDQPTQIVYFDPGPFLLVQPPGAIGFNLNDGTNQQYQTLPDVSGTAGSQPLIPPTPQQTVETEASLMQELKDALTELSKLLPQLFAKIRGERAGSGQTGQEPKATKAPEGGSDGGTDGSGDAKGESADAKDENPPRTDEDIRRRAESLGDTSFEELQKELEQEDIRQIKKLIDAAEDKNVAAIRQAFLDVSDHFNDEVASSGDSKRIQAYKDAAEKALTNAGFKVLQFDLKNGKLQAFHKQGDKVTKVFVPDDNDFDVDKDSEDTDKRDKDKEEDKETREIKGNINKIDVSTFRQGFVTIKNPKGKYNEDYAMEIKKPGDFFEKGLDAEKLSNGDIKLKIPDAFKNMEGTEVIFTLEMPFVDRQTTVAGFITHLPGISSLNFRNVAEKRYKVPAKPKGSGSPSDKKEDPDKPKEPKDPENIEIGKKFKLDVSDFRTGKFKLTKPAGMEFGKDFVVLLSSPDDLNPFNSFAETIGDTTGTTIEFSSLGFTDDDIEFVDFIIAKPSFRNRFVADTIFEKRIKIPPKTPEQKKKEAEAKKKLEEARRRKKEESAKKNTKEAEKKDDDREGYATKQLDTIDTLNRGELLDLLHVLVKSKPSEILKVEGKTQQEAILTVVTKLNKNNVTSVDFPKLHEIIGDTFAKAPKNKSDKNRSEQIIVRKDAGGNEKIFVFGMSQQHEYLNAGQDTASRKIARHAFANLAVQRVDRSTGEKQYTETGFTPVGSILIKGKFSLQKDGVIRFEPTTDTTVRGEKFETGKTYFFDILASQQGFVQKDVLERNDSIRIAFNKVVEDMFGKEALDPMSGNAEPERLRQFLSSRDPKDGELYIDSVFSSDPFETGDLKAEGITRSPPHVGRQFIDDLNPLDGIRDAIQFGFSHTIGDLKDTTIINNFDELLERGDPVEITEALMRAPSRRYEEESSPYKVKHGANNQLQDLIRTLVPSVLEGKSEAEKVQIITKMYGGISYDAKTNIGTIPLQTFGEHLFGEGIDFGAQKAEVFIDSKTKEVRIKTIPDPSQTIDETFERTFDETFSPGVWKPV